MNNTVLLNNTRPPEESHALRVTACFRNVDKRISNLEDQVGEIGALLTKTKIRQFRQSRQLTIYGLNDPSVPASD